MKASKAKWSCYDKVLTAAYCGTRPLRLVPGGKVEATILAIIDEFFRSNQEVLLYMCDTSDGREESRNRLFLTWFERYAGKHRFTIRQAHAKIEGEGLFFCIVVDNRNPHLKAITADFEENAMLLTENKP